MIIKIKNFVLRKLIGCTPFGVKKLDDATEEMLTPGFLNLLHAWFYLASKKLYDVSWKYLEPRLDLMKSQVTDSQVMVLKKLIKQAAKPSGVNALEVGSWMGFSTKHLAEVVNTVGGSLYCVDTWGKNTEESTSRLLRRTQLFDIFSLFAGHLKKHKLWGCVHPLLMRSDTAFEILQDNSFDFIFIDGDHRYSQCDRDIRSAYKKLKPGGILCGHDCECRLEDLSKAFVDENCEKDYVRGAVYKGKGVHCGVVKAVGEYFKEYKIEDDIWYVVKDAGAR